MLFIPPPPPSIQHVSFINLHLHVLLQYLIWFAWSSLHFLSFYSVNNFCCMITTWCVKVCVAVLFHYSVQKNKHVSDKSRWGKHFSLMLEILSSAVRRASVYFTVCERKTEQCDAWIVTAQMNLYGLQESQWFGLFQNWTSREPEHTTCSTKWQEDEFTLVFFFLI